ncbi:MAG: hypothetical protein IT167_22360, partial [Bryobacterales bacterium]|nr:hypothetical protein [Bryobacterales bacterium]
NLVKARRLIDRILAERPNHRQALLERASNALLSAKLQNWNRRNSTAALPLITQAQRDLDATRHIKDPPWLRVSSSLAQQEADLAENDRNFGEEARITATALAELVNWPADLRAGEDYLLRVVAILKRRGNAAYYQDDYSAALTSFQEAYKQLQSFNSQHPNRPDVLYASMDMSYQMAYVFGELHQPSQMLDSTMESLRIAEKLMEFDRENQALRRSYWNKRQALAESLGSLGRFDEAVREQDAVRKARRAAQASQPDSTLATEDVQITDAVFADLLAKAGQLDRACAQARHTLETSRTLHQSGGMTAKNWSEQRRILNSVLGRCPQN